MPGPVRFAQLLLVDLADRGARQVLGERDALRRLDAAEALLRGGHDVGLRGRPGARRGDDDRVNRLAPAVAGNADDGGESDLGQREQGLLDLARVHVEAAGDDHVLLAIDDRQVAVLVEEADVARQMPAVPANLRRFRRVAVVALGDVRPLDDDLTELSGTEQVSVVVHDRDFGDHGGSADAAEDAVRRQLARARVAALEVLLRRQPRDEHGALRLTEAAAHDRPEQPDRLLEPVERHRRRAVAQAHQTRQVEVAEVRLVEQRVDRGRGQEEVRDPFPLDRLQDDLEVDLLEDDEAGPGTHRGQRDAPADVGHRRRAQDDRPALAVAMTDRVLDRAEVAVAEHDALGQTRRAAGHRDRQRVAALPLDRGRLG